MRPTSLRILKANMRHCLDEPKLNVLMKNLLKESTHKITLVPKRPVCPEFASIGIFDYLQINILEKYTVLYRVDCTSEQAFIIAVMRQKQSAEKPLVDLA